jgi:hypothetical protein
MLKNWHGIELEKEFKIQDGKEMASNFNSVVWVSLEFPIRMRG